MQESHCENIADKKQFLHYIIAKKIYFVKTCAMLM